MSSDDLSSSGSSGEGGYDDDDETQRGSLPPTDRFLPIANTVRVMRKVLPEHAKISQASKELVTECASEFISFITSEASERCQKDGRKTINGEDLLSSLSTLGFDAYLEPMKAYLYQIRQEKRAAKEKKKPAPPSYVEYLAQNTSDGANTTTNLTAELSNQIQDQLQALQAQQARLQHQRLQQLPIQQQILQLQQLQQLRQIPQPQQIQQGAQLPQDSNNQGVPPEVQLRIYQQIMQQQLLQNQMMQMAQAQAQAQAQAHYNLQQQPQPQPQQHQHQHQLQTNQEQIPTQQQEEGMPSLTST